MSRVLVAGVDTSTQSCKVRVTDAATGELVRFGQAKHPDGSTVNPEHWWRAFQEAASQAGGLDDVSAIAVGGQQHGMVALDEQGRVIRDAMLWNDTSSAPQAEALIDELGAAPAADGEPEDPHQRGIERWVKAVGSSPVASYTLTKIKWVAQHEPANAARIAAVCLPHDWLSWRIAGFGPVQPGENAHLDALFTDRSDASGTLYFDAASNTYRRDLLALGLQPDDATTPGAAATEHAERIVLPRVLGPNQVAPVNADPSIAGAQVPGGCIIAPGGGDNAMASLGLGMAVGDVSVSLGTSGVAAAISEQPVYDLSGSVSGFADCTGHFLPLACTINASRILDAARAMLDVDYDELTKLALDSHPGAGGMTLVPYFDGGIADPVPVQKAIDDGCDRIVLVLTRPKDVIREQHKDVAPARILRRSHPEAAERLLERYTTYNTEVAVAKQYEAEGKVLILAPEELYGLSTLSKTYEGLERMYRAGYGQAGRIAEFLAA
jgi:xylulokinase